MRPNLLSFLLLGVLAAGSLNAATPFQALYDLDALPILRPQSRMLQVSSHDPSGGNGDAGHFVRIEGNVKVLADLKGPGIVRRIWSANPSGRLRIVIDGATRPIVDAPFQDIFQNKIPGFRPPVAGTSSGGWYSYVPIAFEKSCLITAVDAEFFYYQVTWEKLPENARLNSFTGNLSEAEEGAYAEAVRSWSGLGETTRNKADVPLPTRSIRLAPRGTWAQPVIGPGTLTAMRFQFPRGSTFRDLRQVVLRITFDGSTTPQVEAPLGDFFGVGFDSVRWKSLPMGADGKGMYCYFRMPFRKKATIQLENTGSATLVASFSGTARPGVPRTPWGYFHATYRTAINEAGTHYEFARLRGQGHVVGVTQSMRGVGSLWFLEGDEKVYVDGEAEPGIYGTGTEDYYNSGWYFNTGPVSVATHGCGFKNDNEIMAWRMHVPDPIPFTRSIDFRIEHGGTNDVPGSEYSSVCYWYGTMGTRDIKPALARGTGLLPRPYIAPVADGVEAEALEWETSGGATVRKQPWHEVSRFRGGGRVVVYGQGGATVATPVNIRFTDEYDLDLFVSGTNTDSSARLLIDGKPVGDLLRDGAGPVPVERLSMGPILLTEGRHTIALEILSGSKFGFDAFRVAPRSPLIRDFAVLGPFPVDPGIGVNAKLPPDGTAPALGASFRAEDGRSLSWKVMRAPTGILDLTTTLTPNLNAVAYVSFAVNAPTARTVPLMVGSDDGVQVWVNERSVFTRRVARGLRVDEDRVPVALKEGWNTITLKVDQGAFIWAVAARLPDPENDLQFAAIAPE